MSIFDMKFFRFLGFKKRPSSPWSKYYDKKDMEIKIPDMSLYEFYEKNSSRYKDRFAMDYYGTKITYESLSTKIEECAKAFASYGSRKGDVITICMPNTPEGIISFLALNKLGAVSNMMHPLASENEIKDTLIETGSVMLVLIDIAYSKVKKIIDETDVYKTVIVRPSDSMKFFMNIGYQLTMGRKTELPFDDSKYITYKEFIKNGKNYNKTNNNYVGSKDDPAVMLHSGGSTGTPKAIVLSNSNFITLVKQAEVVFDELKVGDKCLSIMPIFHGFGLGVCVYTPLCVGAECIVVPQFKASEFDKLLNKHTPEFVIGVPTLFEALIKTPKSRSKNLRLNYLKYVISGGDCLKKSLETDINNFLHDHGSTTQIIQGYGMSETLAAIALDFKSNPKSGTFGVPFPGCYIGIFSPEDEEVPYGVEGEICVCGPNVMMGYYNNEKETNAALHIHKDGNVWLHSGDLGKMDKDGYITYTSRLKRLIISSGYNVYPSQIEAVLESHPAVMLSSVVGIPHKYKQEVPKAFIVLNRGYKANDTLIKELKALCKKNLSRFSLPYEYEFRKSLPKTLVGKVDFRKLQNENNEMRMREQNEVKN